MTGEGGGAEGLIRPAPGSSPGLSTPAAWDALYREGRYRTWPNESLVAWVAETWGDVSRAARKAISILEVGCGAGGNLWFLADEGFSACGIDTSSEALAEARRVRNSIRSYVPWYELHQYDVLSSQFPSAWFDAVVDVTCLQHFSENDHFRALLEIRRILNSKGRFWSYRLGSGTVGYQQIFPGNPPAWLPMEKEMREQLRLSGFSAVKMYAVTREYPGRGVAQYFVVEVWA